MKNKQTHEPKIWCTLGPSSLKKNILTRLGDLGVSMFRINLSHTKLEDIEETIRTIQGWSNVPVCLDTEGSQIRSGFVQGDRVFLRAGSLVAIPNEEVVGSTTQLTLRPLSIMSELQVGDLVSIDFDSVLLSIKSKEHNRFVAQVICEGWVGSNKAVTVDRHIELPILSQKDRASLPFIAKYSLENLSLSFVNRRSDVESVRALVGDTVSLISKIETNEALHNLDEIIAVSDALVIDRGDLSREEPINKIPLLQKTIIAHANKAHTPVLVATNLLESMVKQKKPLRSEVNDITNTLLDGADGLVLAAETAIGDYPVECANMVRRMIKYHQIACREHSLSELLQNDSFLLVQPHGGFLVDQFSEHVDPSSFATLPKLVVDERVIIDAEQIGVGTYSPLTGFMTRDELNCVLDNYTVPSGVPWTLPITLQVSSAQAKAFGKGDTIVLVYEGDNQPSALLTITDVFAFDRAKIAQKWFGTDSLDHPGVARLHQRGDMFVGGRVTLLRRRPSAHRDFEFTPRQARMIFEHKEWSKIAGFHTRNAIHRAHEFLQMSALRQHDLDGLFLHPIIGPKKANDFRPHIILESYQIMMNFFYPKDKVVLGAFCAYSHYAGPREAVFTALCRKNYGCSHFIVGRDHTGLGGFYRSDAAQKLFDSLGDLGITPVFFDTVYYCKKCEEYVAGCEHGVGYSAHISGTQAREMLQSGKTPPQWFLRKEIAHFILEKVRKGEEVFVR